ARDAQLRNLPLTLVHVVPAWPATALFKVFGESPAERRTQRIIDDALNAVSESTSQGSPETVNTKVVFADPITALADLSRDAEMIVVGSRGRSAVRRALHGSVSTAMVRRSHCPVAVIHDEDPLMPHPAQAPVLVRYGGSVAAAMLAREEASRRGVGLIISDEAVSRLVEQSESAQLAVIGGWDHVGATVAQAARMPVIVA
ncbi:MAG: universal stress protein, partial [Mycobacterium sp.]